MSFVMFANAIPVTAVGDHRGLPWSLRFLTYYLSTGH